MAFPFAQVMAIVGANRQLALKFFDIARAVGARQTATGARALAAFLISPLQVFANTAASAITRPMAPEAHRPFRMDQHRR